MTNELYEPSYLIDREKLKIWILEKRKWLESLPAFPKDGQGTNFTSSDFLAGEYWLLAELASELLKDNFDLEGLVEK